MSAPIPIGNIPIHEPLARISDGYALDGLAEAMCEAARRLPQGWPLGYERRLLARGLPKLDVPPIPPPLDDMGSFRFEDSGQTEHLLRRPPSEVAAWRLWMLLDSRRLAAADLCELSGLLGGPCRLRTRNVTTTAFASGERLAFLEPARIGGRLEPLLAAVLDHEPKLPPLLHAVGVYFDTLLIHPLSDGNGRLARLLFQGTLRRTLGLAAPVFPLGPALALHRPQAVAAYLAWEFEGDARPLVQFVLSATCALKSACEEIITNAKV